LAASSAFGAATAVGDICLLVAVILALRPSPLS
jgi:hypothetical protein